MPKFICETCGVQYSNSETPPDECIICNEERQYVNPSGQTWTTLEEMQASDSYENEISEIADNLFMIQTKPAYAIGQTAYLIQNKGFNLLWDCITYLDVDTVMRIKKAGGIDAIALSHPHYYSSQVEWAETFDALIYIHEDDRQFVTRESERIRYWHGDSLPLHPTITLHRLGGHFKGAAIAHWNKDSGKLFTGDIIRVAADRNWTTFMYSYPNFIPLSAKVVERMANQLGQLSFEQLYDAFQRTVETEARQKVLNSAARYISALNDELADT